MSIPQRAAPSAAAATGAVPLRVGFLGLGWIGRMRLDAVAALPGLEIAALADTSEQCLQQVQQQYSRARAVRELRELLALELDAVVIATPNACHAAQALACLAHGLPVFCQKPLGISALQTEQVVRAAQRADRLLAADFCYRHVQGMPELRQRLRDGELGSIEAIDLVFHNAYAPNGSWCFDRAQAGGGCLLDLGIHLLDLVQWLLGGTLQLVSAARYADGRRLEAISNAVEDLAFCEYRHESGTLVRLACSWRADLGCAARIGADIHGARAGARWRNVNDSFMDFVVEMCRGTQCERLGGYPDDWAARAMIQWLRRLSSDRSFDPLAWELCSAARLIEEAYQQ